MLTAVEQMQKWTQKAIAVRPNAGLPRHIEGRQIYMSTPEYLAHFTKEFFAVGVQFVGGCCGTSPEHIKSMSNALRYSKAVESSAQNRPHSAVPLNIQISSSEQKKELPRVPLVEKSKWSEAICTGRHVMSVELLPPMGLDPSDIIRKSRILKEAGVDAINIPDGPRASARMSAILTAIMIEQQVGIETVLHYTCRDRNLLSMQSDMLGAHAIGLRNMLLITGDPPKLGSYPNATGVFDVDAIGLVNMVYKLNGGFDLGERPIGSVPSLSIGVGVNPVHRDFEYEMNRFHWKVKAGAEWAITQPVFDMESIYRFFDYIEKHDLKIPIIAGVWPLLSYRNALFMNNEVPGVVIPSDIMNKMEKAKSADDSQSIGIEIAQHMIEKLKNLVHGVQVSAPFGKIDLALKVMGL
jgi:homocysteine S-methyltransferase